MDENAGSSYTDAMDDLPDNSSIKPPANNKAAAIGKSAAKGLLGAIPVAGSLAAEAAEHLLPDPNAKDRARWEGEVTDRVNTLDERVGGLEEGASASRSFTITGATAAVAKFMIEGCPDGVNQPYVSVDDVMKTLTEFTKRDIRDAFGDLEYHGLVQSLPAIGRDDIYRLTDEAYVALDKPILGFDTKADAQALAQIIIASDSDSVSVPDLEQKAGWPRRRFNPALRLIVERIHPGRVSQSIQPDYVTRWFSMSNAERADLRRFAAGQV